MMTGQVQQGYCCSNIGFLMAWLPLDGGDGNNNIIVFDFYKWLYEINLLYAFANSPVQIMKCICCMSFR